MHKNFLYSSFKNVIQNSSWVIYTDTIKYKNIYRQLFIIGVVSSNDVDCLILNDK